MKSLRNLKGFGGFYNLSNSQCTLWAWYYQQKAERDRNAKFTEDELITGKAVVSLGQNCTDLDHERYLDDWWYLVRLAPTKEAKELNALAASVDLDYQKRLGQGQKINLADLRSLDAKVNEIRGKMRNLPIWTPEQIEEALSTVPEEMKTR